MHLLLLAAALFVPDASASVCTNFVAANQIPTITCDGTGWTLDVWGTDPNQLNGYGNACSPLSQAGPEFIIPFACPGDTPVEIILRDTDCDVDLYVLAAGCTPGGGCLASSTRSGAGAGEQDSVTLDCYAGQTKYIVVEGYALDNAPATCPWGSPARTYRHTGVGLFTTCDEQCGDGFDNDGDLLADCADPECGCVEDCSTPGDEDGDLAADCNDLDCLGAPLCCDNDRDGYPRATVACGGNDCADYNAAYHPGVVDVIGNGIDEDCSGGDSCYADLDRDGYGSNTVVASPNATCQNAQFESTNNLDCSDTVPGGYLIFPNAAEVAGDGIDQNCDGVDHCWRDVDRDTWGAGASVPGPSLHCEQVAGWARRNGDCRDSGVNAANAYPTGVEVCDGIDNDCNGLVDGADPAIGARMTVYPDADGDGYGISQGSQVVNQCTRPPGYAAYAGDCDDGNPARAPGLVEIPYDGIDQDCSGADINDLDGDGYTGPSGVGVDCNEQDPLVYPGRRELADGIDQNCDGEVDEGTVRGDDDGDGFSELGGDCDDAEPLANPGEVEVCDPIDNDCDGRRDEGTGCADDDGDGWTDDAGDCNDHDPRVSPVTAEVPANGLDDNCDGYTDRGASDLDHDGFSSASGDCNDNDPGVNPVAAEVPNGVDDDCNGRTDDGTDRFDDDGDGFTEVAGDCWDGSAAAWPGAPEVVGNGVDDDCDGRVDEVAQFADADRDGWTGDEGDCDDADRDRNPGEVEVADGKDNDCDKAVDEAVFDLDADGVTEADGDCDDGQGWASPLQIEVCDGIDNDCDGASDEGCVKATPERASGGCASAPYGGAGAAAAAALLLLRRNRWHRVSRERGPLAR